MHLGLSALIFAAGMPALAMPVQAHRANDVAVTKVKTFHLYGGATGWQALDRDTLVIWTSPSRPYLVKLDRGTHDLRIADSIGVTSLAGHDSETLDSVIVGDTRHPIREIYAMSRAHGKKLIARSRKAKRAGRKP